MLARKGGFAGPLEAANETYQVCGVLQREPFLNLTVCRCFY